MRFLNTEIMSAESLLQNINGDSVFAATLFRMSVQAVLTGTPTGTLKIQGSNDPSAAFYDPSLTIPTNWNDISGATVNITASGAAIIPAFDIAYQYIRAVYTATGAGIQTVTTIADTGVKQVQTVSTVADVAGSLNSTYFLVSSVNLVTKAQKDFYVWLDNGTGVDPAVPSRTGVQVVYADNDSANTLATLIRAALNALTNDFVVTGATNACIITNKAFGLVTVASDGVAATGFGFANTTPGVASNLNNKYFYINQGNNGTAYYVWLNVDTIGTDPAVAGKTAVPVAITSGSSNSTIATAVAAALDALAAFASTALSNVATVTNSQSGPFVAAVDVNTGFTIAITAGNGTISANLQSQGY